MKEKRRRGRKRKREINEARFIFSLLGTNPHRKISGLNIKFTMKIVSWIKSILIQKVKRGEANPSHTFACAWRDTCPDAAC